jgi:hypothetical protein
MRYEIKVPGEFRSGVAFLDLETVKVAVEGDFRMPNGEPLRKRWSIALAGVARDGWISIVEPGEREEDGLAELGGLLDGAEAVLYGATREFDEMICRGRFTNARRAHLPAPVFPAVPGAETLPWKNLGSKKGYAESLRGPDIASREVPAGLFDGRRESVLVHLLRDVAELILLAGEPDEICRDWCEWILIWFDFASRVGKFL